MMLRIKLKRWNWRKSGEPEPEPEHVGPSLFQAENQSFTLIDNVMFLCFPPLWGSPAACPLFTVPPHPLIPLLDLNPDKWTHPPPPSQQLRVTDFKAQDMNNQTVIFSFSSSCYWPDFMIFSSFPPAFCLPLPLSIWTLLLLLFLLDPCRLLICTRSSSRFRIKGRKLTRRTTTESLQPYDENLYVIVNIFSFLVLLNENKGVYQF